MTTKTGVTASGTVVLLSGGLDSVAALHWALASRPMRLVRAIGFRWGQPLALPSQRGEGAQHGGTGRRRGRRGRGAGNMSATMGDRCANCGMMRGIHEIALLGRARFKCPGARTSEWEPDGVVVKDSENLSPQRKETP